MSRQVALLRGVNVGGRNMVSMAELRELLKGLGFEDVRTHLQSGNVVYTSGKSPGEAAAEIEAALARDLGVQVPVLARTGAELGAILKADPLGDVAHDGAFYLVTFLSGEPDGKPIKALDPEVFKPDVFRHVGKEIYVWCPNGVRNTKLSYSFWEKKLGVTATARNWKTVTKLHELAAEG
ncbi:DUF1697 domain-containing protein [Nonomuraea spiralis]|uniref:DUF1697 domain-containing protein n=1 Tax=Nonomuraea spiralis TaxID=46182 RepID=A0ABV5IMI7_9ACTN|nr:MULTISPECIES: DUF1697 domain-containing protein [Nonomuraea]RSM99131.1 hypothetical protein DMB42_43090 [Nonomuraea sp. WAC 01424]GGT00444.1 hypothetical protein GCM10010176_050490 [Nonomuraea spiralis]